MKMRMIEPNFWKGHGRYHVTKKALKELKRAGGEIHLGSNYVDTLDNICEHYEKEKNDAVVPTMQ